MSNITAKLAALGITLPPVAQPAAAYVPFVCSAEWIFLSGHIAKANGQVLGGRLGADRTLAEGQAAARGVAIDLLGTLHAALQEDWGRLVRLVKLSGFVQCTPEFNQQHLVINGASELLAEILGAAGQHARSAVGVAALPLGACVEIELIAQRRV